MWGPRNHLANVVEMPVSIVSWRNQEEEVLMVQAKSRLDDDEQS